MLPILHQSIWRDEAFTLLLSLKPWGEIIKLTSKDASPPLFYLMLHYWLALFGNSEITARVLPFLFHILTTFVVLLIVHRLTKSLLASCFVALAVLFNPFLIQYAFEIRGYSLLAFITVASYYFLLENKRVLAGLFLGLGILTHNFGIFNAIAFGLWYFYTQHRNLQFRKTVELFLLPFAAFALWETVLWSQWTKVTEGFWIQPVKSSIFLHTFQAFTTGGFFYPTQDFLFMLSFVIVAFAFSYWILLGAKKHKESMQLILSLSFGPLFIAYVVSAVFTPIYHERYLIASLPFLIILVGYSLYQLFVVHVSHRPLLAACIGVYAVVLVQSFEYVVNTSTKPPINYAVSQVLKNAKPGDIIIPENVLNFLETKYYVQRSKSTIPVYAYTPDGKIPFYIGAILYDSKERITKYPKNKRIWEITSDAGFKLRTF